MMPANVKLSKNELALVCNEAFILTKNEIIGKVYDLFGLLSIEFEKELAKAKAFLPDEILYHSPKIYKGEQYKSLPYVMLDQPRCFNKNDVFAIRCFFWWGNFFSITLHLGGRFKTQYQSNTIKFFSVNTQNKDWYYCTNDNQWQHDFDEMNYTRIPPNKDLLITNFAQKDFLKLATKIPLTKWEEVYDFYTSNFRTILLLIHT